MFSETYSKLPRNKTTFDLKKQKQNLIKHKKN